MVGFSSASVRCATGTTSRCPGVTGFSGSNVTAAGSLTFVLPTLGVGSAQTVTWQNASGQVPLTTVGTTIFAAAYGMTANTPALGSFFQDTNSTGKRIRFVLSGLAPNTQNTFTLLGGTAAATASHTHTPTAAWMTFLPIMRAG